VASSLLEDCKDSSFLCNMNVTALLLGQISYLVHQYAATFLQNDLNHFLSTKSYDTFDLPQEENFEFIIGKFPIFIS